MKHEIKYHIIWTHLNSDVALWTSPRNGRRGEGRRSRLQCWIKKGGAVWVLEELLHPVARSAVDLWRIENYCIWIEPVTKTNGWCRDELIFMDERIRQPLLPLIIGIHEQRCIARHFNSIAANQTVARLHQWRRALKLRVYLVNKYLFFSSPMRKPASASAFNRFPLPASFPVTSYSLTKAYNIEHG